MGEALKGAAVLFLPDAGPSVGLGHVVRSATLARELARRGVDVGLLVDASALPFLAGRPGVRVEALPDSNRGRPDSSIVAATMRAMGASVVVTDSYRISAEFVASLRLKVVRLLVVAIDDDGSMAHLPVDAVLGCAFGANRRMLGRGFKGPVAAGPSFVPLGESYSRALRQKWRVRKSADRVLVTLGGSDPEHQTPRVLAVLRRMASFRQIDVVLGPLYDASAGDLDASADSRVRIWRSLPDLAERIGSVDLAVAGAGTTTAELAFVGVPSVLLTLAGNQVPTARRAAQERCAVVLGPYRQVADDRLRNVVRRLQLNVGRRQELSRRCRRVVDGRGAERSADFIQGLLFGAHVDRT